MTVIHRIRLRNWPAAPTEHGTIVFTRAFGAPQTLDPEESVWLVCEQAPANGSVTLNSQLLGTMVEGNPFATDITTLFQARNLASVEVQVSKSCELEEMVLEFRKG